MRHFTTNTITAWTLVFLFFIATTVMADGHSVVIDSLHGKVEVQRTGMGSWHLVGKGYELYTNDVVRVLEKSHARLAWPDGSRTYVRANSQVLIAIAENTGRNIISQHLTVFTGAVFFVVKHVLPDQVVRESHTKVFTPTMVVATRGTSFVISVEKETGKSVVGMLSGTTLVRNILKRASLFLGAGYKTEVTMNTDPILPQPMLDEEITSLKKWVPPPVVNAEMKRQLQQAKRDHLVITGKYKDKCIVLPFANHSRYNGTWDIGTRLAAQLAQRLSGQIKGHVVSLSETKETDPLIAGAKETAKFAVRGHIAEFDISQHAEISAAADEYRELRIADIRLHVQLINIEEKTVVLEQTFSGESFAKLDKTNSWQAVGVLPFDPADKKFSASILGKAVEQVLDRATQELYRYFRAD